MADPFTRKKGVFIYLVVGLVLLGTVFGFLFRKWGGERQRQPLSNGEYLALGRVVYGTTNPFLQGSSLERLLGDWIPTKGIHFAGLQLQRPTREVFGPGKPRLAIEVELVANPRMGIIEPPGGLDFAGRVRCIISGEDGIEYGGQLWPNQFKPYRGRYFAYILSSSFPRDSKRLHLRIDRREGFQTPWHTLANFSFQNPTRPASRPWVAQRLPITVATNGMEFELGEVTVEMQSADPKNATVLPFCIRAGGVTLTNWTAIDSAAEDATGNWNYFTSQHGISNGWTIYRPWHFLDPRSVWKLDVDFSPESGFSPESLLTLQVPSSLATPLTTNFLGLPVTISWVNRFMLDVEIPTNAVNSRVLFIKARDATGRDLDLKAGSWRQHGFWRMLDPRHEGRSIEATIAVVPNVHASYVIQPRVVTSAGAQR